jgi:hypothetical protein
VIVEVMGGTDEVPKVKVVDVDNLTRLHLALGEVTDEEAGFVGIEALHAAAAPQSSAPDWARRWEGMVAAARDKGWVGDDGASLQVHVESAAGA